jgi:hypothetical protein
MFGVRRLARLAAAFSEASLLAVGSLTHRRAGKLECPAELATPKRRQAAALQKREVRRETSPELGRKEEEENGEPGPGGTLRICST